MDQGMDASVAWEVLRNQLRSRRVEMGLSQVGLAAAMGKGTAYVAYMENTPGSLNLATFLLWLDALGGSLTITWSEPAQQGDGSAGG